MKNRRSKCTKSFANHLLAQVIFFSLTVAFSPATTARGDFMLSLSLGTAEHISANQVAFNIDVLFQGSGTFDSTDYINAFTFSLDSTDTSIALKTGVIQDYDRYSFDTFRNGWAGGIDPQFGSGGLSTTNLPGDPADDTIHYGSTPVMLARMVIDTTGLTAGSTYTVSLFNPNATDAAGFINGSPIASLVTDFSANVNLNASSSFNITAVPEPSSILYGIAAGMFGGFIHNRKKLRARVRNR